jgi:hypothetical protein
MIQVRMRTTAAGPDGIVHAGQVVTIAGPQAAELLAMGYADQVGIETATSGPPETAMRRPVRRVAATEGQNG